ncbi:leucine-rich repeat, immunoglobulin-like domain and transmembrane domain-containing protein 2 [Neodiprion lecontei]|uniref:Leucine-rich repeat, immunoglobulin-like domain and transmembrane domain-containing protein 2 n=1 Tax=Neodiprion lecontei TaxID=441921 RepID=A0A6J0BD83_NEOLC|nr:leucine-rich repeat, immunoglobulin-like domain and transmembrane domain-containing protein 2 [Neodiprion lecontei]
MKLQSVVVFVALCVLGLTEMASAICLLRNVTRPVQYWYQCFRSDNNYLSELKKSPIDIPIVTFTNSRIPIIRNGSFTRFGRTLETLGFLFSGVEEIEDRAFWGLRQLNVLALPGNKLKIMKSVWFEGLPNLRRVSFENNQIKRIEENVFAVLPPLEWLDVSSNKLSCIPTAKVANFKARDFQFRHNRLTWSCQVLVMDWLKETGIRTDYLDFGNLDPPYDLAKICVSKLPTPKLDEAFLNKCVGETTRKYLPPMADYTVKDMCEYLRDKPSPFLDCSI